MIKFIGRLHAFSSKHDFKTIHLIRKRLSTLSNEYFQLSTGSMNGNELTEGQRHRINSLQPKVHIFQQIDASLSIIDDAKFIVGRKEILRRRNRETQTENLKQYQQEALDLLIEADEYDDIRNVTVEVRPGVGGSEGSLFAEDLMNMLQAYSNQKGWDCRVVTQQKDQQIGKGCKLGVLTIIGDGVYSQLKCESGVHKVIRVPETESKGRLHSSTASVVVMPKVVDQFSVNERDLRIEFMRASGPGGQHVNKTESACRVTHIPTGIQVLNMEDRSQDRNKARAMQILREKLFALHVQEKQDRMAQTRKSQVSGTDRSDKIRTYNFPQERITDHRTNLTLFGMEKMLQGQLLDEFIEKYQEKIYNAKLEDLIDELNNS